MATKALSVVKVFNRNGRAYINWSDKSQSEFRSLEHAKEYVRELTEDNEFLRRLALARYFFIDPNATNPNLIEGRTITVTNESNTMVTVS